jgi:hypothetical protein
MEAPVFLRLVAAWQAGDGRAARDGTTSSSPRASRGAARRDAADGLSLRKLLRGNGSARHERSKRSTTRPSPRAFAFAASRHGIDPREALAAYLFAWVENQALAALKAIPLGPNDGSASSPRCRSDPRHRRARRRPWRRELSNFAPGRPRFLAPRDAVQPHFPLVKRGLSPFRHNPASMQEARNGPLRVGIGGPVGSGKTALTLALCQALRDKLDIAAVTNDIYTEEDAQFLVRNEALAPERIIGVETGGCPHTAIREDASINLEAVARLNSASRRST